MTGRTMGRTAGPTGIHLGQSVPGELPVLPPQPASGPRLHTLQIKDGLLGGLPLLQEELAGECIWLRVP